nr:low molecular weight phosphotyrosine protein phosphatase-like [Lytechinus pictus]
MGAAYGEYTRKTPAAPLCRAMAGNICRSVTGEAIFRKLAEEKGFASDWKIDSAATSTYQIGDEPDPRTNETLKKNMNIQSKHIARQYGKEAFERMFEQCDRCVRAFIAEVEPGK